MNIVDIFLAAAILIFGWIGFRRGTLRIVLSIIGLLVGGALGAIATPSLQSLISTNAFGFRPKTWPERFKTLLLIHHFLKFLEAWWNQE